MIVVEAHLKFYFCILKNKLKSADYAKEKPLVSQKIITTAHYLTIFNTIILPLRVK